MVNDIRKEMLKELAKNRQDDVATVTGTTIGNALSRIVAPITYSVMLMISAWLFQALFPTMSSQVTDVISDKMSFIHLVGIIAFFSKVVYQK